MVNKDRWQYDTTMTVRLEKSTKDRLCEAAQAKSIPLSEHIRDILTTAKLPEELLAELSQQYRERVERFAEREGRSAANVVSWLFAVSVAHYMNSVHTGF